MRYSRKLLEELIPFSIKLFMVVIVGLLCLVIGSRIVFGTASSIGPSSAKEMAVPGKAEKKVNPDSAQITLGKNLRGTNIGQLQTQSASAINNLTTKLKELGIKDEQMKTSNYNLSPVYTENGDIRSYSINIAVELTLEKSNPQDKLIGQVIEAGTAAGIDEVRNLNFYLADYDKLARELEDEAIADAKKLAQQRAESAGIRLGKVLRVDFGGFPIYYGYDRATAAAAPEAANSTLKINAGQVDLQTTVTVVFELQ